MADVDSSDDDEYELVDTFNETRVTSSSSPTHNSKDTITQKEVDLDPVRLRVVQCWEEVDKMESAERGDKDMTKEEVQNYLSKQANPFEPFAPDREERVKAVFTSGDLNELQKIDNVTVYESQYDRAKNSDETVQARTHGLVLTAKQQWDYFCELNKIFKTLSQSDLVQYQETLKLPKWLSYLRYYPVQYSYATSNVSTREIVGLKRMLEQKQRLEEDPNYTMSQADAAITLQHQTEWAPSCPQVEKDESQSRVLTDSK